MVLQKRLDYGISGYQFPWMPSVPRSARGKRSVRKKIKDNQLCAFDLLTTVAGRLLLERENSLSSLNVTETLYHTAVKGSKLKEEEVNKEKSFKTEVIDQQSCTNCILGSVFLHKREINYDLKEHSHALGAALGASVVVNSNISNKNVIAGQSIIIESHEYKEGLKTPLQAEFRTIENVTDENSADIYSSEDPMDLDTKPPLSISSNSSVEIPLYSNNVPWKGSFPRYEDGVELAIDKDNDENSSGCTHPSIPTNKVSRLQRRVDRRIKKLLSSRHQKLASTLLQGTELSSYDVEIKPALLSKRICYARQRAQRGSFKRKKVSEHCFVSACDGRLYHESTSNACESAAMKLEARDSHALHEANGASSSSIGHKSSHKSSEYHVKVSIKSFKVPELVIDIPENATIGALKKTVMETMGTLLGGGLHVGILLQGKKIEDDDKTLYQSGILHKDKLESLGFTLEPNSTQSPAPLTAAEDPHLLSVGQPDEPLARISSIDAPAVDQRSSDVNPPLLLTSCPEIEHDSIHSPADAWQLDRIPERSCALVVVPPVNFEALAVVPLQKSRCSEVQRRMRRPFTVAEVEALVQAVEKLGTGRWRDVKLRSFDNAKHRTYVDLKDKWKTLVHTARISPQQRRGAPVPQELLDRVLSAHSYWTQQQAKLQLKPPPAEPCLLH